MGGKFDVLMIPGTAPPALTPILDEPKFMTATAAQYEKSNMVFTVCSGSVILAHAGCAKGLELTTHKTMVDESRAKYPEHKFKGQARFTQTENWGGEGGGKKLL